MKIFTIGFTKTNAKNFFSRIKESGTSNIVDVRLNNVSQLSGFAKRDDLKYFADEICGVGYHHSPELAPTKDILDAYKKKGGSWEEYEDRFIRLMTERHIEDIDRATLDGGCLLCSEDTPHHCHRRLIAEYLNEKWGDVEIVHL